MKLRSKKPLILPSTIAFYKEGRLTPGYSLFDWLHGYVYGRWPYLYIRIGTGEHPLSKVLAPAWNFVSLFFGSPRPARNHNQTCGESQQNKLTKRATFADTYHGKVVPLDAARQLISVNEEIRLTNLEKIIPYAKARDIILKNPEHIVVIRCPCRSARAEPCLPLDVCLVIGEPFASFVFEHHPDASRRINSDEAEAILQAEDERGHVHHAFFKDAMLGRFYAICNCCACCCGAMNAHRNGTPMLVSSGYISQVDADQCSGCGVCTTYCQFGALSLGDNSAIVDMTLCMGCGICVSKCDRDALFLVREPAKGEPLEITNLIDRGGCLVNLFVDTEREMSSAR